MRKLGVAGILIAGLVLSGCAGQGGTDDDAWNAVVAEDYASARARYQSILAENPDDPYANLNIGVAHEELGNRAQAAQHYRVAIANGANAEVEEVARDGLTARRVTTVRAVAQRNLARLGG